MLKNKITKKKKNLTGLSHRKRPPSYMLPFILERERENCESHTVTDDKKPYWGVMAFQCIVVNFNRKNIICVHAS